MVYEGMVYRPPSEAYSLIFQVTVGCSHNKCTFCTMFKDKKFHIRKPEAIRKDMLEMRRYYSRVGRIFLADGDALCLAAATDGSDGALMLVNAGDTPRDLAFETNGAVFRFGAVTDEDRTNDLVTACPTSIGPHAFMLLVFDRPRDR